MNLQHVEAFKAMASPGLWVGAELKSWVDAVAPEHSTSLPKSTVTRKELRKICLSDIGALEAFWAVMAWGKMRPVNAQKLSAKANFLASALDRLRRDNLTRGESFDAFKAVIADNHVAGIGPAFFTKVIFFMAPQRDGYIMDQWTARSVNLLASRKIVRLNGRWVSKRNDGKNYEDYCGFVEELVPMLRERYSKVNGEWVEMALFSQGGRAKVGPWRRYLLQNGG